MNIVASCDFYLTVSNQENYISFCTHSKLLSGKNEPICLIQTCSNKYVFKHGASTQK